MNTGITVNYKDLVNLGYKVNTAKRIIKQAKTILVSDGYALYSNSRCGVVPAHIIEKILNIKFSTKEVNSIGKD